MIKTLRSVIAWARKRLGPTSSVIERPGELGYTILRSSPVLFATLALGCEGGCSGDGEGRRYNHSSWMDDGEMRQAVRLFDGGRYTEVRTKDGRYRIFLDWPPLQSGCTIQTRQRSSTLRTGKLLGYEVRCKPTRE